MPLMKNASDMAGLTFLDAMQPGFAQRPWTPYELIFMPYRDFARVLYNNHPNGQDCTHMCNTPMLWGGVWRSLRLAMDRAFGPHPSVGKGYAEGNFTGPRLTDSEQA